MSSPVKSVSVPKDKLVKFDNSLPMFLEIAGMKGKPAKFSTIVWRTILEAQILDSKELSEYAAVENMKTAKKKYIVLAL